MDGRLAGKGPVRICFPFVGDRVGGSHISALKLIQNVDRRLYEPVVVVQQPDGPLAAFLKREGMRHVGLPLPGTLSPAGRPADGLDIFLTRTLPYVRSFIREGRFDVVHTNDGRGHVNWGLAARLAGARLVWHHRGDPGAKGANWLAPLIASHMVTVSRFARPSRPVLPMGHRLSVIHSPFDRPSAPPDRKASKAALLAELGLAPGTRILGYFGNLVDRKRPLLFVDVVHRMRRRHPELPIVGCLFGRSLPGKPDLEPAIRERAQALGIGDAVRLMGFRQPVEPCIAAVDVLLVPAVGEPFGRSLVEAMFLGTPVVAVDHGGNPEAIEDGRTGFLVSPENADAFVEPLARLLREPALFEAIGRRARDEALHRYGIEHHVDQVTRVYRQILDRAPRPRSRRQLNESLS